MWGVRKELWRELNQKPRRRLAYWLLPCLASQVPFFYSPGAPVWGWCHTQYVWPSHISCQSRKSLPDVVTGQCDPGISFLEDPSFRMTLGCMKLPIKKENKGSQYNEAGPKSSSGQCLAKKTGDIRVVIFRVCDRL